MPATRVIRYGVAWFRLNVINPLMGTLKPQRKRPLYSNTVVGTLTIDGWTVTFGTARRAWAGCAATPSPLLRFNVPINGHII